MPAPAHLLATSERARSADFRVVDEGDDYLVVDKPPFLLIHPSKPNGAPTLWAALRELLAYEIVNGGQVSIVNRLDRETSGLVLIAKNSAAAREFGRAMQRRQITKEYLAIVHGWPAWEEITVDVPIVRQGEFRPSAIWLKQTIDARGAPAQTHFRVEERFVRQNETRQFAVVRAFPQTGRTHQIRVHLKHLGHPIMGDKIYGPNEQLYLRFIETGWTDELAHELLLPRHALHSARLRIDDAHDWQSDLAPGLRAWKNGNPSRASEGWA